MDSSPSNERWNLVVCSFGAGEVIRYERTSDIKPYASVDDNVSRFCYGNDRSNLQEYGVQTAHLISYRIERLGE